TVMERTGEDEGVALVGAWPPEGVAVRLARLQVAGATRPPRLWPARWRLVRAHVVHRLDGHVLGSSHGRQANDRPRSTPNRGQESPLYGRFSTNIRYSLCRMPKAVEPTSARHDASIMFSLTPIV